MKITAKNLKDGISSRNKLSLVAIFSLLTLIVLPSLAKAVPIDTTPIDIVEVSPFFKDSGFVINNNKAPNFGEKYWLEKKELVKKYEINLAEGYRTNLKDGLYPIIFRESPKEELIKYYQENSDLDIEYIKDLVNGTEAFAYVKVDDKRASLVRNKKITTKSLEEIGIDSDKLFVNYHFPVGEYSFLLLGADSSTKIADWQFRVVNNYPATDIFAVETAYNSLTLGGLTKVYQNIVLPKDNNGLAISWTSSNPVVIATDGIVTRPDDRDVPVSLTAHIVSGSFSMDKIFELVVIKNDPYLKNIEFTTNGKLMHHKDNQYFFLEKQEGVKDYIIDFAKSYKTNLQDGTYGIRYNDLSQDLQEGLVKYYSSDKSISQEDIKLIVNGQRPYAYIQVISGKLSLISAQKASIKPSVSSASIIDIDKIRPLIISAEYPNGVYSIIADLDGFDGLNKVKWQLEVVPEVIVDPNIALVEADRDALSLSSPVTEDFDLPTNGANGSSIGWQSDSAAINISGNLANVTRPEFAAGDAVVHLIATLSKGSITKTRLFDVTVLKNDQVIIPPTTGGGGGGVAGSVTPQSVNAINFPLSLISSQNGVLTQSFANGLQARLVVYPNSFVGNLTFRIAEGPEGNALGGSHFALTAIDSNGNPVRNFANNLNITFSGLSLPGNVSGLGVYYYDEALLSWILVPGAIFNQTDGSVNFSVNHLTNFAVFAEQPATQQVLGQTTYADGTLLRGSDKHIFIVVGGKLQRILSLKELAQYADREILQVEDSVIAAYGKVSGKTVLGARKYNFARDLKTGMTGDDVQELQRYLNNNGYALGNTGPGSTGQETKKFGRATREALIRFQKANKINPAVGYFGTLTRKIINK